MRNIFTLLCKLITVTITRKPILQENNLAEEKMQPVEPGAESFIPVINNSKKLTSFGSNKIFRPSMMMGLLHGRWSASEVKPEDFGINLPQHLSPVAVMQPVSIYNNTTSNSTQTNRMKQVLLAAKNSILGLFSISKKVKPIPVKAPNGYQHPVLREMKRKSGMFVIIFMIANLFLQVKR